MKKILIISDNELFGRGIEQILEKEENFDVTFLDGNSNKSDEKQKIKYNDIYLLDVELDDSSTTYLIKDIFKHNRNAKILLFSGNFTPQIQNFINIGINGFVKKSTTINTLILSIKAVIDNQTLIPLSLLRQLCTSQYCSSTLDLPLSNKEIDILQCVAAGYSNKTISEKMFMSTRSVEYQLTKIYKKLESNSRSEAISKAISFGLIQIPTSD